MVNSKKLLREFLSKLRLSTGQEELSSIGGLVMEKVFGLSQTDLTGNTILNPDSAQLELLDQITERLNKNEPLQYILNEAYFYGRKFFVDSSVLIPRPETEELVSMVVDRCKKSLRRPVILDIGTGSGCIPVTLALELPSSKVYALDKSKAALAVAEKNAKALGATVNFFECDILRNDHPMESIDVIVSNPPYILMEEKSRMQPNVTDFEPHLALFVENDDPFIFYSAIANTGNKALSKNGFVAVEINERLGKETAAVFKSHHYASVEVVKDISGKDRIVIATK